MWKLGLRPRKSFSGNIRFEFLVLYLCSAYLIGHREQTKHIATKILIHILTHYIPSLKLISSDPNIHESNTFYLIFFGILPRISIVLVAWKVKTYRISTPIASRIEFNELYSGKVRQRKLSKNCKFRFWSILDLTNIWQHCVLSQKRRFLSNF